MCYTTYIRGYDGMADAQDLGAVTSVKVFRHPRSTHSPEIIEYAPVMELVDMRDLGSRAFSVWVRVPSGAPSLANTFDPKAAKLTDASVCQIFYTRNFGCVTKDPKRYFQEKLRFEPALSPKQAGA